MWILGDCLRGTTIGKTNLRARFKVESVGISIVESVVWLELSIQWTKSGNSSGGTTMWESVIGGENLAKADGLKADWSGMQG